MKLTEVPPPSEPVTLFEGLLGSNLDVLTQDAAAHPDRYDDVTRTFLEELAAGQHDIKALPRQQAELLNRAVMDFASFKPPRPPAAKKPLPQNKKPALLREEDELPDDRAAQMELPDGDQMRAYWWL